MAEKQYYMTLEGKANIENELNELKSVRRKEVVENIKIARSFGDLSENAEYDSAKEEQAMVEGRIAQLEEMLRNVAIISEEEKDISVVGIGTTVTFLSVEDNEEDTYTIVGSAEADPFTGKISNESPIAKSLMGHQVGDQVSVPAPGGEYAVKITSIK
ncbi:transcription elongation factor GreA [Exiguobacterium indicum]|jgi:transcription elongation factor GreA|uniref:Transcription elongation factor GreA n=2 Tax=Exiguobacterium TaxID=33986 RepID=A0A0V8GJK4_9BACL|nr:MULTISPECIES: transcription elongation factor GreA [Exiguobacterium]AOT01259.1 transcription elongation factor GreA [Exiguobacterium sp. U13-1]EZP60639.1 Transcript cleavage factor GreA [Exiguobacterium sp. RIT341]KOP29828.1 transcription elongation factor GreA [Exiguobacterium sp. BMC-KP]KQS40295.1 transcription elongation factor GreA [Exiguobacterium sp. Leaf196]KSU50462.1 transcription elongation factor GreA [Exiguobacterium enclense]